MWSLLILVPRGFWEREWSLLSAQPYIPEPPQHECKIKVQRCLFANRLSCSALFDGISLMLNVRRLCVVLESVISATIIITIGRVCICLNFPCLTSCLLCCLPMCFLFLLPVLWSGSCVEVDVARIIMLLTPPPTSPSPRPSPFYPYPKFFL